MNTFENSLLDEMNRLNISYQLITHQTAESIEHVSKLRKMNQNTSIKSILFKHNNIFSIFSLRGHLNIDSKKVRKILHSHKLSFASREQLYQLTQCIPGTLSPFGFPWRKLPLYLDDSIKEEETVAFTFGSLEQSLILKTHDYCKLIKYQIYSFAKKQL